MGRTTTAPAGARGAEKCQPGPERRLRRGIGEEGEDQRGRRTGILDEVEAFHLEHAVADLFGPAPCGGRGEVSKRSGGERRGGGTPEQGSGRGSPA